MIRRFLAGSIALAVFSGVASAQQSRAELLRSAQAAYDDFAPDRALDLLKAALNPTLGPADTAWTRGVHLLTQILVEGNNQDLAKTWARWAARINPGMPIDSVNFLAGAVGALREGKTFVQTRATGDAVTTMKWRWATRGSTDTRGRIIAEAANMATAVNVRVVGGALVPNGVGLALPPGSYEIEAAAPGYLPARLTREVLPGVTTVLTFTLTSAAVASDVIADNLRQHSIANAAALMVKRFGTPPSCIAGAYVGRDGLVATSYEALRGAESVTAMSVGGDANAVRIAAYDVSANLAILKVPSARTDSLAIATNVVGGQSMWAIGFPDCRTAADARVRLTEWTDEPRGTLQLSDAPANAIPGSPMVDVAGKFAGIWANGTTAVPAARITPLLDLARRNLAQNQGSTLADVAKKENHAFGSAVIASDAPGTAKVSPLETWQWREIAASGPVPFNFAGPAGRYRVEVTGAADARREQEITIRPGAEQRVMISLRTPAPNVAATQVPLQKKKSKLPWILVGLGLAGGGAAAALAGGGGGPPQPPPPPPPGGISLTIPVNQP